MNSYKAKKSSIILLAFIAVMCFVALIFSLTDLRAEAVTGEEDANAELTQSQVVVEDYILSAKDTTSVTYVANSGWRIDSTDGKGEYLDQQKVKSFYINPKLIAEYYERGYTDLSIGFCHDVSRFGYDPGTVSPPTANCFIAYAFAADGTTFISEIAIGEAQVIYRAENGLGYGDTRVLDINLEGRADQMFKFYVTNMYPGTDSFASDGIMSVYVSYIKFSGADKEDVFIARPRTMSDDVIFTDNNTVITKQNGSYKIQSNEETMNDFTKRKIAYIPKEIIKAYKEAGMTQLVLGFDDGRKYGLEEGQDFATITTAFMLGNQVIRVTNSLAENNWEKVEGLDVFTQRIDLTSPGINYDHDLIMSFSNKFSYDTYEINKEVYLNYIGFTDGENYYRVNTDIIGAEYSGGKFTANVNFGYYTMAVDRFGAENVEVGALLVANENVTSETELTFEYLTENGIPFETVKANAINSDTAVTDGYYTFEAEIKGLPAFGYKAVAYVRSTEMGEYDSYIYSEQIQAELSPWFETVGASVRLSGDASLRFISVFDTEYLEAIDCDSYKIGTVLKGGVLSEELTVDTEGAVKIENGTGFWTKTETETGISAYIYGIAPEHYGDTINARAYLEITKNGKVTYIYGETIERSLSGVAQSALDDVSDVADGEYIYQTESGKFSKYNDEERAKLQSFITVG